MRHVTHETVYARVMGMRRRTSVTGMSHGHDSCLTRVSHIIHVHIFVSNCRCECVMSYLSQSYARVMGMSPITSVTGMSHGNES